MRKPRDIDAELKQLAERTRDLRKARIVQLGELVIACGADAVPVDQLAGALLQMTATRDASMNEAWRLTGAAFFQGSSRPRKTAAPGANEQPSRAGTAPTT